MPEFLVKVADERGRVSEQVENARREGELRDRYATRSAVPKEEWDKLVAEIEAGQNLKELGRQVAAAGGLHVIGTERHEALRIDRQLAGRAARQGDPGSCQFFLALDDELLESLGTPAAREFLEELAGGDPSAWRTREAQQALERQKKPE